jgi:stress-induced morphogen
MRATSLASSPMGRERISGLLRSAFPDATVEVTDRTGTGDHFHVAVVSAAFDGLSLVEQHRLVNRALEPLLTDGTIHELRITTKGTG